MKQRIFTTSLTVFLLAFFTLSLSAQEDKSQRASPPAEASGEIGDAEVTINYSQVGVKERKIWDGLVPYGKVWRTGANEATVFETSEDLKMGDNVLPAGKYGLFTIPGEDKWTVIFNSDWEQWGAYNYSKAKDVLRVMATPSKSDEFTERLTFAVKDGGVHLMWENLMVTLEASSDD